MGTVDVNVKCSAETYAVVIHLANLVKQLKAALKDGFQPGQDLAPIVQAVLTDLVPALSDLNGLSAEMKEDLPSFERAIAVGAGELLQAVIS